MSCQGIESHGSKDDKEELSSIALDTSTIALLDNVLKEKAYSRAKFYKLQAEKAATRQSRDEFKDDDIDEANLIAEAEAIADLERLNGVNPEDSVTMELPSLTSITASFLDTKPTSKLLSVEEFQSTFPESWQLSQFWYSSDFVDDLYTYMYSKNEPLLVNDNSLICFLCCPTSYVGFQHKRFDSLQAQTYLLEYDKRFEVISPENFCHYNLNEPDKISPKLINRVDLCIIDPPFLNIETNQKIARSVSKLLKPNGEGRILLVTGQSIAKEAAPLYSKANNGPQIERLDIDVKHASGIANGFEVWSNL